MDIIDIESDKIDTQIAGALKVTIAQGSNRVDPNAARAGASKAASRAPTRSLRIPAP